MVIQAHYTKSEYVWDNMFNIQLVQSVFLVFFITISTILNQGEIDGNYKECLVYKTNNEIGFQLNGLIVIPDYVRYTQDELNHEYGHYLQQLQYGDLYLPIVASGSLIGNAGALIGIITSLEQYRAIPTEQIADILGGNIND